MSSLRRRDLLAKGLLLGGATIAGTGCGGELEESRDQRSAAGNESFRWTLVTTWPPTLPIFMDGVRKMASEVEQMSQGRLVIDVYGAGELVPAFETFDAVSSGTAQMGHGAAYYWSGKVPAAPFFTTLPFGMNAQQSFAWLLSGGGQALWDELYAPYNLKAFAAGSTGVQMGGWFAQPIESENDFAGLKMRIPGLAGEVVSQLGGSAVLLPAGEIYTSLERGVIDATEWVGPYHDALMGFQKVVKNYHYPGWHEPGTVLELMVHRPSFESLPQDLRKIVEVSAMALNSWMLSEFEAKNHAALAQLVADDAVELVAFPQAVLDRLREVSRDVVADLGREDELSGRIAKAYHAFSLASNHWADRSERAYYEAISLAVAGRAAP